MKEVKLFLILLAFTWSILCIAQTKNEFSNNLKFKNYSTKDGLSQRSVTSILQDNKGFMWFGTRYGLNKFDGNTFTNYNYDSEDLKSISHNRITDLVKDSQGTIWVGTRKGLSKYIPEHDNFIRVKKSNSPEELYNCVVWDIKAQDSTYLWIATNEGLDRLNIRTGNILNFTHNSNNKRSIGSNKTRGVLLDNKENLWIATTESVDFYDVINNNFIHFEYPNGLNPILTQNSTIVLFQDSKGKIWLGYNNGLAYFNSKTNTFEDFKINSEQIISTPVRTIFEDQEHNLWIGTYDGLYKLNESKTQYSKYVHDITNPNSLSQNSIYDLFEDTRGDLWIGSWAGGISYYDKSSNNFTTFSAGYTNKSLNYKVVSAIVEDEKENLWIGTEGGGLNYYNKDTGEYTYFTHNLKNQNSISTDNVKAILKDHKGDFWIGTHMGGLNYLKDGGGKKFKSFNNNSSSLSDSKITVLAEDSNYNIWIGTNEGGLNLFDKSKETFIRIKDSLNVLGNFIHTLSKSNTKNSLIIGSNKGLAEINTDTKEISTIDFRKNSNESSVLVVYQESASSLWIGTEGDGLFNYNFDKNQSFRYGTKNGLPNEVIYGILPDNDNHIWLSTNKGLSRLNLETKQIKNFDESDGLQANEFNYGAYHKSKNGNLFFGGINGFTIFNPRLIKDDTFIPPVTIRSFNIRNKPHTIINDSIKLIELKYNQNDFSFDFVALNYSQANKNEYAYKLEGFDTDWKFIGNNKTAVYTNINPGDYTFKVKASNSDGVWNEKGQHVSLKISPPLWRTWWAYLVYTIVSISIFLVVRKHELSRIQNRNALKKERLDKEQMEEVNRLKLQLFTNISHDFRTPLTLIVGPLKRMIDQNTGDNYVQNQLKGIYRNASILLQLINQLLDFRKSEAGKLHLHAYKYNIVNFLKDIQLSFSELALDRNIKYNLISSDSFIDVWFDKIEMKKVILNILSNAFKFTPQNGEISIIISELKLKKEKASVKIEIKDTGKGIREEDLEFVFDRYFQLGQQNELRSGTGVGLALAKDIVELHHGEIYVKSTEGKGSCFIILLPLGNKHLAPEEIIQNDSSSDLPDYFEVANIKPGWIREDVEKKQIKYNKDLLSVLLVEDNLEVRQFIKEVFEKDFNVFEAENGQEGIHSAQLNPIDVIISDVMMPEMDGMEMCHKIKSDIRTSHIPVILLTARTSSKMQKAGYKTGADVYLTKPFEGAILKQQVYNILQSRQNLIDKFKQDILLEPKEITVVSTDEIFLKKAMEIVEENLSEANFNVNSFIDKMFMSQSVVYRKIKVLTGQSISEFIRSIRLKKASQLLCQTNMSIANIAYDTGFNDLKYFRKCFKSAFNETPSRYRKINTHL